MRGEENSIGFSRTSTAVLIQFSSLELISSNVIIFIILNATAVDCDYCYYHPGFPIWSVFDKYWGF